MATQSIKPTEKKGEPQPPVLSGTASLFGRLSRFFTPWGQQPLPQRNRTLEPAPTEPKSLLQRINSASFDSFPGTYAERKGMRRIIAGGILERGRAWAGRVNWRQFALLQCPGIIRATSLEGGTERASVEAALSFIDDCLAEKGLFFHVDVDLGALRTMREDLSKYGEFLEERLPYSAEPTPTDAVEKRASRFLKRIENELSTRGRPLYIPMGYREGASNQGHAIACKAVEEKGDIVLTLFNLGNGSDAHPVLDYTLNHRKMSFRYFPIRIPKEIFFGRQGHAAICHLLRYLADAPPPDGPYDGNDIYDILLQFITPGGGGRLDTDLGPLAKEYASPPQLSGNCSELAVQCAMDDAMICSGISREAREKIHLNRRFYSLIAAYHAFKGNSGCHPAARKLLHDAAQSFGGKILDLYRQKALSEQELISAQAVVAEVIRTAEKEPYPPEQLSERPIGRFEEVFPSLPTLEKPRRAKAAAEQAIKEPVAYTFDPAVLEVKEIAQVPALLREWSRIVSRLPQDQAFHFVVDCMRGLPIPTREAKKDSFSQDKQDEISEIIAKAKTASEPSAWDLLPPDAIPEVVRGLEALIKQGLQGVHAAQNSPFSLVSSTRNDLFVDQFLTIYTAFAIIDALARRDPSSLLDGFSTPFLPFNFQPHGFSSLPLHEDNDRFSRIYAYFTGRTQLTGDGHQEPVIFPIAPELPVEEFVGDHLAGRLVKERVQGRNHIRYIAKLLPQREATPEAAMYCRLWSQLPPSVRSLYYFVYLSHSLLSAPGQRLPMELTFSEDSIGGKGGLKIEGMRASYPPGYTPSSTLVPNKGENPVSDRRFFTNGICHDQSFVNLFDERHSKLTTNDAVCYPLSERNRRRWNISEPDIRMLLYITRRQNLSFWQALQVFSSDANISLLSHPGVQEVLDICFFQPRFLLERLKQERDSTEKGFRKFILQGLSYFQGNRSQISAFLFLVREGTSFESYTAPGADRDRAIAQYRHALDLLSVSPLSDQERYEVELHVDLLEGIRAPENPSDLFASLFKPQKRSQTSDTPWLARHRGRLMRDSAYKYARLLQIRESRNSICRRILQANFRERNIELPQGDWMGSFPQYSCGNIELDFLKGTIFNKEREGTLKHIQFDGIGKGAQVYTQKYGTLFWVNDNGGGISLCGKLRCEGGGHEWFEMVPDERGLLIERPIVQILPDDAGRSGQEFLAEAEYLPFVHYQEREGVITCWDRKRDRPYLRMEKTAEGTVYTRLAPNGEPLPLKLANLSSLPADHRLSRYTTRLAGLSDRPLCFVDAKTGEIQELNFYKGGIEFVRDEQGLVSNQHPGFYLIANESDLQTKEEREQWRRVNEEFNGFPNAFNLYNPNSKKWLILFPHASLEQKREDFSREVSSKQSRFVQYSHLEFDPEEKSFRPLSQNGDEAYTRLSLLFKMQRDYDRAYKYLKKINPSSNLASLKELFLSFTSIHDYSLASLAFNLKLSLLLIRNENVMVESRFLETPPETQLTQMKRWWIDNYKSYIGFVQGTETSGIPEGLRVSDEEKKILLIAFRRAYREIFQNEKEGWEEKWKKDQPILDIQYHVLFHRERENTVHPREQEISFHPPLFSMIRTPDQFPFIWFPAVVAARRAYREGTLPKRERDEAEISSYPNFVSPTALMVRFPELYQTARRCNPAVPDPFDYVLHALIKGAYACKHKDSSYESLANILFWVRYFPDHFDPLTSDQFEDPSRLQHIEGQTKRLKEAYPERYAAFIESVLRGKRKMKFGESVRISAPREQFPPTKYIPQERKARPIGEIEARMHQLFNKPYKLRDGRLVSVEEETVFLLEKRSARALSYPNPRKRGLPKGSEEDFERLPDILMQEVILRNKMDFFFKHRPMLSVPQMEELCHLTNEWHHARLLLKMEKEGTRALYLPYDYQQFPEIAYFYLKTGKFPRKAQLETFSKISSGLKRGRSCHFQLPAGEGKTDVVIPLLTLAAERLEKMAVTCVTQAIYPVDKANLSFNLQALNENLCCLEVGMHMINTLTAENLERIYAQLVQYKREGRSLILTPQTYYALFLSFHLASKRSSKAAEEEPPSIKLERGAKIRWSKRILDFFKRDCLFICDESHSNLDPLTRAIYGLGDFVPLSPRESAFLFELMKPLLPIGAEPAVICGDGRSAVETAHLSETLGSIPERQELQGLQIALARSYLSRFPIPADQRSQFLAYWTDEKSEQPPLLRQWAQRSSDEERQYADQAALVSAFLLHLLPDILKMRTDVDHGRSLYPQRKHDVPCRNKLPSTAVYDDPYKTCALTIKGTYARGLSREDVREMLGDMIKLSADEQRQGYSAAGTPSNVRLQRWLAGTSLLLQLKDLNPEQIDRVAETIRNNPEAIEYFLHRYSFAGIGSTPEQITCTTTDLLNAFSSSVSFSATPRERLSYPRLLGPEDYLETPEFQIEVRTQMRHPKNQRKIYVERAEAFFQQAKELHPEAFQQVTVLIDPRGFFTGRSNLEVARDWMANNPALDGVLYWKEGRSISVDRNEKISLLCKNGTINELDRSDIVAALKELGLDWERLHLGTIFDPTRTESANILQKQNATAFFFPSEGLTSSHAIQALMRLRGFVNQNQSIIWVFERSLARKIFRSAADLSSRDEVRDFLAWTDENEREQEEKRIILNAFQEIAFAIGRPARAQLNAAFAEDRSETMERFATLYGQYADGFTERLPRGAYASFGEHERKERTGVVLRQYAKSLLHRFNYRAGEAEAPLEEVEQIIASVERRIGLIYGSSNQMIGKEVEQLMEQRSENQREQENQAPRPIEPLSEPGSYGSVRVYLPDYLNVSKRSGRDAFETQFLSPLLYLSSNQLITAKIGDTSDQIQVLKPIHFYMILLVRDKEGVRIYAETDSNQIISTDQDDLTKAPPEVPGLTHKAFLVAANGTLVQRGVGALALSDEEIQRFIKSTEMVDLSIDAALLQGQIIDPERLLERIGKSGWDDFEKLWMKILKALLNPECAHLQRFEELKQSFFRGPGRGQALGKAY